MNAQQPHAPSTEEPILDDPGNEDPGSQLDRGDPPVEPTPRQAPPEDAPR
ncbi:hypothetical protein ACWKWZ_06760 [Metapseudomonas otitidis]|jgi:hypothetical protein|uniref:Uncharacterized protein n=1 Tax=Metapseudomonas otitidis TaxID=319939 RepID=A0ABU3XPP5_9GAMM|nr:hypothetical protein [Pseudomonas otitidis]MDH0337294.1 hypothetical protein [Pseudomonas otitidis]MDH1109463.1 hypothetical protein [Pseudomonas otitidis]MDH1166465.1 hypothetical protein [Pseudomonas otitidis]MDV3439894.1 hypothetical protein [Pseudomonas otitidis]MEE1892791.1 hypothetical protein [Pseudomonas otitidis]